MTRPKKDPYRLMKCGNPNCDRTLAVKDYGWLQPGKDISPEKVHRIVDPAAPPYQSVYCTCGHFTQFVRRAEDVTIP